MSIIPDMSNSNYIERQIRNRLTCHDCPLYDVRDKIAADLFFMNMLYVLREKDLQIKFLDTFVTDNGRFRICIKRLPGNGHYRFLYAVTDKYRLLSKLGE